MSIDPKNYPYLLSEGFENTSSEDATYNCVAWAVASDVENWWWPPGGNGSYWPPSLSNRTVSVAAFTEMFVSLGFEECEGGSPEEGFEKVALYTNAGVPTHAARQVPSGQWTHKMGQNVDIQTTLKAVQDSKTGYGRPTKFFRKKR